METTITLNEQQVGVLMQILEVERISEHTSKTYNTIVNQIQDKLLNNEN